MRVKAVVGGLGVALLTVGLGVTVSAQAQVPGRPGLIAYTRFTTNAGIWTVPSGGGASVNLSGTNADDQPAFSPSGTLIAFRNNGHIWTMSPSGRDRTDITPAAVRVLGEPAWSPSGRQLAVDDNGQLGILTIATGGLSDVATTGDAEYPSWSPDGTKIAFDSTRNQGHDIIVYTVASGASVDLTNGSGPGYFDQTPDWSPDGTKILFTSSGRDSMHGVQQFVMNADGTGITEMPNHVPFGSSDADVYSPDGAHYAFVANDGRDGVNVFTAAIGSTGATELTDVTGTAVESAPDSNISWQPVPRGGGFVPVATTRVFRAQVGTTPTVVTMPSAVVPAGSSAVVVNVEVFDPSAAGYVRVTPAGSDPSVAVQEFAKGQTISNQVTVGLVAGQLQVKVSAGSALILMDVSGYFTGAGGSTLTPTATTRVFDGQVATTPTVVTMPSSLVPAGASGVVVNVEVSAPSAAGYVRVTPAGADAAVAVQEFAAGQTISNLVVVKLTHGQLQVKVSAGSARILMDVSGYYAASGGSTFVATSTARVFAGQVGTSPVVVTMPDSVVLAGASAVVVNVEVYNPSVAGYVRVTPAGADAAVAVQEFARGQTISNLVVVKLTGGQLQVKVSAGSALVLMDVSGYYLSS